MSNRALFLTFSLILVSAFALPAQADLVIDPFPAQTQNTKATAEKNKVPSLPSPEKTTAPSSPDTASALPKITVKTQPRVAPRHPAPSIFWTDTARHKAWYVRGGDYLQETLDDWCHEEQVTFMSETPNVFYVPKTVNFTGTFENAIERLLSQYAAGPGAPTAQLYIDPKTGHRVLILRESL